MEKIDITKLGRLELENGVLPFSPEVASKELAEKVNEIIDFTNFSSRDNYKMAEFNQSKS